MMKRKQKQMDVNKAYLFIGILILVIFLLWAVFPGVLDVYKRQARGCRKIIKIDD